MENKDKDDSKMSKSEEMSQRTKSIPNKDTTGALESTVDDVDKLKVSQSTKDKAIEQSEPVETPKRRMVSFLEDLEEVFYLYNYTESNRLFDEMMDADSKVAPEYRSRYVSSHNETYVDKLEVSQSTDDVHETISIEQSETVETP
ncbi:hypothetical protein NGRA_0496, partial [Nosema granulosis]